MRDDQIKDALDRIEPEEGAQQRMYQNILRKASARQEAAPDQPQGVAPTDGQSREKAKIIRPVWQKYLALAACFILVVIGAFALRPGTDRPGEDDLPPVLAGSPIQDVSGPEDFAGLDLVIDAPEGAAEVRYSILDGEIARIDFILEGHSYTYSASRVDGDFSGVSGTVVSSRSVDAEHSAVLEQYDSGAWNACWMDGELTYYLSNSDGVSEDAMTDLTRNLISLLP